MKIINLRNRTLRCIGTWTTVVLGCLTLALVGGCDDSLKCSYCGDQIWGKDGWQIWEYWLCDRCHSHLDLEASKQWGCGYNKERMRWVWKQVDDKQSTNEELPEHSVEPDDTLITFDTINEPQYTEVRFEGTTGEILRLEVDGDIYWKDELVVSNEMLVQALCDVILEFRCPQCKKSNWRIGEVESCHLTEGN